MVKFLDLKKQYLSIKDEIDKAIKDVIDDTAFIGGKYLEVFESDFAKYNNAKFHEGMIVSNEPGYYLTNKFGIRIENLIYTKKKNNKLKFENLTLAPIDKSLINFNLLNDKEKSYLDKYHRKVYFKLSPFLNKNEKNWLKSFVS